jgi:hypothetical protein
MNKLTVVISAVISCSIWADYAWAQERHVRVTLHRIEGYGAHEPFAHRAAQLLEDVLNSDEFKTEVLKGRFNSTQGLTNLQLYQKIMTAHEEEGPGGQDGVVDLRVRILRIESDESRWKKPCDRRTIGVDGAGTGTTAICPQKLIKWATDGRTEYLAAHYAHEYIHILGFHHKVAPKTESFVYQVGDIVERLAEARREFFKPLPIYAPG